MWSICRKFTENGVTTQVSIFRLSKAYCYKWHIIWHSRLSHHLECFLCLQSSFPPMYPCRQHLGRASHVGRSGLTCRPLALAWPALACWGLLGSESTDRTLSQPSLSSNLLSFFSSDSKKQMRRVVGYHLLSNSSLVCQRVLLKKKNSTLFIWPKGLQREKEKRRLNFYPMVHSQNACNSCFAGKGRSKDSVSQRVTSAQPLEPRSAASQTH